MHTCKCYMRYIRAISYDYVACSQYKTTQLKRQEGTETQSKFRLSSWSELCPTRGKSTFFTTQLAQP